jgi:hypothetical protein
MGPEPTLPVVQRRSGVLVVLVALLLAGDAVALATVDRHHTGAARPPVTAPPATLPPVTVLPQGQAVLSGTVTAAHLAGAVGPPLSLPLVISIPNRGQGELNIERVRFQGQAGATVAWDGGQPLPLSGTGALSLGPATVDVNTGGLTWHLDGMPRLLTPGRFTTGSAVAIGVAGLAQPLDQATFDVAPGTHGVMVTVGDVQVHQAPRAVHVTGPGQVQLLGRFTVRTAAGTRAAANLHFGPGPFDLTLQPVAGGFGISGVLQGPITLLQ